MHLRKPDDCYELNAFRRFRDTYLRECTDGEALIQEYYRDAPKIVMRIWLSGQQEMVYPRLWKQYLRPCLEDIEAGRQETCKARYVAMVRELQRKFFLI